MNNGRLKRWRGFLPATGKFQKVAKMTLFGERGTARVGAYLIALVLHHPAAAHESKDRVAVLKAELEAKRSPEIATASKAQVQALDLWETAEPLLAGGGK